MVGYGASGFIRSGIPIACGAQHTAWQIGISETQRQCIYMDPLYEPYDFENPPMKGLEVARQIGMVSYRTAHGYQTKFGRNIKGGANGGGAPFGSKALWDVKTYLEVSRMHCVHLLGATHLLPQHISLQSPPLYCPSLTTHNSQLTTHNSQLTTHNSQLTTHDDSTRD